MIAATMFPTFDVPPQHAETVGARKARKQKEDDTTRRASSATSQSSGSSRNVTADKPKAEKRSVFGWGSKSKSKEIQEIPVLASLKKPEEPKPEPAPAAPSVAPSDWSAALEAPHHDVSRRPSQRSYPESMSSVQQQRFPPPPPLRSLPSAPPSGALPPPPSPGPEASLRGRLDTTRPDIERLRSQMSHVSLSPSTTSSDRTVFSSRSVFSSASASTAPSTSGYDSIISEENYNPDPRYASNLQLEPVDSRSGSRAGERGAKVAQQSPFARALAKMEGAGPRIITARLSEEWEGLDDDESYQEVVFEKRLWALTAYQRLTQNKQIQSPAHELLSGSRPADQRRILHLHGSLADGWMLATRYPAATVYTTSSLTTHTSPTSHPAPLNHHSLYVPSLSAAMPFPDGYFDAIVSRSVSTVLRNDEWARSFFDCRRVLKPGGQIEILSVDAHLSSEGGRLSTWVDEHIVGKLEAHGLSKLPSDTVLDTMEIVGLENIRRARVALPAYLGPPKSRSAPGASPPQDVVDASRMMAFLGRHFYQDLYGKMMHGTPHGNDEWFWSRKDVQDECERHQTKMVLTIACAMKPSAPTHGESYLDL